MTPTLETALVQSYYPVKIASCDCYIDITGRESDDAVDESQGGLRPPDPGASGSESGRGAGTRDCCTLWAEPAVCCQHPQVVVPQRVCRQPSRRQGWLRAEPA